MATINAWGSSNPAQVALGGTGDTTLTANGVLVGNTTGAIAVTSAGATGQVLIGNTASAPTFSASPTVTGVTINGTPSASTDAATVGYVTTAISAVNPAVIVVAATTATLNATYLNGAAGVGATLVNAGALAAFSIDGQSPSVNSRILVKNQSTTFQNGIYTLTTVGSGAVAWVLTRATNYDTVTEINETGVINVTTGTVNAGSGWVLTTQIATIGTDAITYTEFIYPPSTFVQTITGNTGGALTPSSSNFTFSGGTTGLSFGGSGSTETLSGTVVVANGGTGLTSITSHDLMIGNNTTAVTLLAPSATSGVPLISQGASADPAYGTAVVAGGGTGVASTTAYAVITGGTTSTGALQSIASVGTSGQVLTSNGASALPTFQTAAGGGGSMILIQTQTASSSASINFTTGITSTYNNYVVQINNLSYSSQDNIKMLWSVDGGATYLTSGYLSSIYYSPYSASSSFTAGTATDQALISENGINLKGSGTVPFCATINLYNLANTSFAPSYSSTSAGFLTNDLYYFVTGFGVNTTLTGVNAIRFISLGAQNITTGNFSLYGIAK